MIVTTIKLNKITVQILTIANEKGEKIKMMNVLTSHF